MNRNDFMEELKQGLKNEDYGTVSEIINDYEEYFAHGILEGRSEEEICSELGTPKQIIDNFIEQGIVEKPNINRNSEKENNNAENKESNYSKTISYNIPGVIGLVILNFFLITVIALPVGGTIFGLTVGFSLAVIPCFIGALIMLFTGNIFLFFAAISVAAFMLLVLIGIYFLVKWIVNVSKTYINWNINMARGDY